MRSFGCIVFITLILLACIAIGNFINWGSQRAKEWNANKFKCIGHVNGGHGVAYSQCILPLPCRLASQCVPNLWTIIIVVVLLLLFHVENSSAAQSKAEKSAKRHRQKIFKSAPRFNTTPWSKPIGEIKLRENADGTGMAWCQLRDVLCGRHDDD